ncbi:MAG TPA: M28 family peptidase [Verrucomicrobiae bacterium]|jgi:Zn-dependent M28 family amino/carboxypeptidase|nr:M28 family peptidase [Verrucomicrobiae bacterium]
MRLLHSSQVPAATARAEIRLALETISSGHLREWVQKISVPRHYRAQPQMNEAIARWLADELRAWGYDVELQGSLRNVVAWPRKKASEMVVVGAHYDSVPETPGADDNGSAVAALLGCAEACARMGTDAPVCFAAFNCEEDGMWGSAEFVANLKMMGRCVRVAHILEMVGFASTQPGSQRLPTGLPIRIPDRGDFLGILANQTSGAHLEFILGQARAYSPELSVVGLEVPLGAEQMLPVLARSDHLPFWNENIPAVMWTDTSEFRNPHYHRMSDKPDTLDYAFLQRVTQVLTACVIASAKDGGSRQFELES